MSDKIRLLIVDDEERFLKTLSQRLAIRDFEVEPVNNGEEAVARARAREFDVALVDLRMPGMDGEQVLELLKREHPFMEVIILTGHGSIDSAVKCTTAGSFSYLQKPAQTEELLEVLRQAYQKRVQRKLQLSEKSVIELAQIANEESPLGILRRLKELENARG